MSCSRTDERGTSWRAHRLHFTLSQIRRTGLRSNLPTLDLGAHAWIWVTTRLRIWNIIFGGSLGSQIQEYWHLHQKSSCAIGSFHRRMTSRARHHTALSPNASRWIAGQSGKTESARSSSHCRRRRRRDVEERSRRTAVFLSVTHYFPLLYFVAHLLAVSFNLTALGQPILRSG